YHYSSHTQLLHSFPTRRSSDLNFPTGTATLPFLSSLNSTRPAFTSRTAFAVSSVTVPALGLGINPRGPRTFPSFRTSAIAAGVRSEEHTSELQSRSDLVCRLLL